MPYPSTQGPIGLPFIELQTVDSTNNYALELIRAGMAVHGMAIFAHQQTAGKGQRGKTWTSTEGQNIALSLVLQPSLQGSAQFQLSAAMAVAARRFFHSLTDENTCIKWPNDLYWKDRKAGGILIENIIRGQVVTGEWQWSVVGIGININQTSFPPELPNPVSLRQITGKTGDPAGLARSLCTYIDEAYRQLTTQGFETIYREYVSHLYKLNQIARFARNNRVFEAKVTGVSPAGKLLLLHGMEESIEFGEIEWRIDTPIRPV